MQVPSPWYGLDLHLLRRFPFGMVQFSRIPGNSPVAADLQVCRARTGRPGGPPPQDCYPVLNHAFLSPKEGVSPVRLGHVLTFDFRFTLARKGIMPRPSLALTA